MNHKKELFRSIWVKLGFRGLLTAPQYLAKIQATA